MGPSRGVALLALVGAIQFLVFSCLAGSTFFLPQTEVDQIKHRIREQAESPRQAQMAEYLEAAIAGVAVGMIVVLALPGLAHLLLALKIRKGSNGAAYAAKVILWIQIALVGLIVLLSLPSVFAGASAGAAGAAFSVLPLAGLLVLMVVTVIRLRAGGAMAFDAAQSWPSHPPADPDEPWNTRT